MKKILLTLGLSIAAMAMSFNGISQSVEANTNKAEVTEVAKKACCKKGTSKAECAKMKASSKKACASKCSKSTKSCSKTSAVAGMKQEAKATAVKSCSKGKKSCCKSKMKASKAKVEKISTEVKAN